MFEQFIQETITKIYQAIDPANSFITLNEIMMNSDIPKPYKAYFAAEVDWWIYEEQFMRKSHKNFDFNDSELESLSFQMDNLFKKTARLENKSLVSLIDSAVKTRLNFLVRPRTTLKWFIFRGEPTKPFQEIIGRLHYFSEYDYFSNGFMTWASDKNISGSSKDLLSVIEFEKLIESIDQEMIFDLSVDELIEFLNPLFLFFNYESDFNIQSRLPIEALILFFDDKGIYPVVKKLQSLLEDEELNYISKEVLISILNEMLNEPLIEEEYTIEPISQDNITDELDNIQEEFVEEEIAEEEIQQIKNLVEIEENEEKVENSLVENALSNLMDTEILNIEEEDNILIIEELAEDLNESVNEDIDNITEDLLDSGLTEVVENESPSLIEDYSEIENISGNLSDDEQLLAEPDQIASVRKNDYIRESEQIEDTEFAEEISGINRIGDLLNNLANPKTETNDTELEEIDVMDQMPEMGDGFINLKNNEISNEVFNAEFTQDNTTIESEPDINIIEKNYPSLISMIDEKLENKFQIKLFDDDHLSYTQLITDLNKLQSWKESAKAIDLFFAALGINPNSAIALEFNDFVQSRFR